MNKRIYLNDRYIDIEVEQIQTSQDQSIKGGKGFDQDKYDPQGILDNLTNPSKKSPVKITVYSFMDFLKTFMKGFYYIEAAGGFIQRNDQFLFIHRHGRWDLPKGKLEKKETAAAAAVRECEEECGIRQLVIQRPLSSTFHIYPHKDAYALKQTYWYYMNTSFSEELTPQKEEHIDQVTWFGKQQIIEKVIPDTYPTIRDVIRDAIQL